MERVILHVDMDAFFASVEVIDNPKLKGKPVIVGGISERGVVATCSYEARKYGVRSAMPVYIAKALCPNGIYLPTRMARYKEISEKIFQIFYKITPYVEPLSIDEAYLDITELKKDPVSVAMYIKEKVKNTTGLTISVGVSYNKFLAKLASDWNKPNGLKIIRSDMIPKILLPLPVSKIYGLGKKSAEKLNAIGIFTIEELHHLPEELLTEFFGKYGVEIYKRIRGIDNRKVVISRERKSIGRETTLRSDTNDKKELEAYIKSFCSSISKTLITKGLSGKTITLKIKTSTFENHTKNKTLPMHISKEEDILREALEILYSIDFQEKIRLIGVSVSSLEETKLQQLTLFNSDF
ncbi:DNA polymerase IV [Clostridium aciditolerans]|uniref:DNA polymerase IV n=1 Tax=Clostridium aciditolerans TaxID=339861 RepID=A0A934I2P0_9CLOT|nr:DNA polymerase IV [Clostridium aciditolerans]MBI6875183.1 DNA polymerase IV [Clostridium aciditolerans]